MWRRFSIRNQDGFSTGTLTNCMSACAGGSRRLGNENVMAGSNAEYGIDKRMLVTNISNAKVLDADALARVTNSYTRMSRSCRGRRLAAGGKHQDQPLVGRLPELLGIAGYLDKI